MTLLDIIDSIAHYLGFVRISVYKFVTNHNAKLIEEQRLQLIQLSDTIERGFYDYDNQKIAEDALILKSIEKLLEGKEFNLSSTLVAQLNNGKIFIGNEILGMSEINDLNPLRTMGAILEKKIP